MIREIHLRRTFTVMPEIDQNWRTAQDEYVYNIQNEEARAYILDLGRELRILHVSDIKIEIQKELFGEKWHSISVGRLTESLDNFEIKWEDWEERQDSICDLCLRSNFARDPQLTLKERRKHQRLAYQEKLHIFKRFIKEGLHIQQLCSKYCI